MSKLSLQKKPTLAQQAAKIARHRPTFRVEFNKHNQLNVCGQVQPSARSLLYSFKLIYVQGNRPIVHIVEPGLEKSVDGELPPHLYGDNSLCLYLPSTREFSDYDWLNDTIIPWISLWLFYYEDWLTNGFIWNGGGIHPNTATTPKKRSIIRPTQ